MTELTKLCIQHVSDKYKWGYTEIYSALFEPIRSQVRSVLEIGVFCGSSLRMWRTYFPNAHIYGLDIRYKGQYDEPRITTAMCDQSQPEQLAVAVERFGPEFDIIIDDGSHVVTHQEITRRALYPHVRTGGYYIIEDINHGSWYANSFKHYPNATVYYAQTPPITQAGTSDLVIIHKGQQ